MIGALMDSLVEVVSLGALASAGWFFLDHKFAQHEALRRKLPFLVQICFSAVFSLSLNLMQLVIFGMLRVLSLGSVACGPAALLCCLRSVKCDYPLTTKVLHDLQGTSVFVEACAGGPGHLASFSSPLLSRFPLSAELWLVSIP